MKGEITRTNPGCNEKGKSTNTRCIAYIHIITYDYMQITSSSAYLTQDLTKKENQQIITM